MPKILKSANGAPYIVNEDAGTARRYPLARPVVSVPVVENAAPVVAFSHIVVCAFELAPVQYKPILLARGKDSKRRKVAAKERLQRFNAAADTAAQIAYLKSLKQRDAKERAAYYKAKYKN